MKKLIGIIIFYITVLFIEIDSYVSSYLLGIYLDYKVGLNNMDDKTIDELSKIMLKIRYGWYCRFIKSFWY